MAYIVVSSRLVSVFDGSFEAQIRGPVNLFAMTFEASLAIDRARVFYYYF